MNRSNAVAQLSLGLWVHLQVDSYFCKWLLLSCFGVGISPAGRVILKKTADIQQLGKFSTHTQKEGSSSVLNPALVQLLPQILRQFHSHSFTHCHLINFSLSDMIIAHEFVTYMPCMSRELPRTI